MNSFYGFFSWFQWLNHWGLIAHICIRELTHPWWRHQMETFSALLNLCAGNSLVIGESPSQRPVTGSFDVFFDLPLNKRLSKQSWHRWFETGNYMFWNGTIGFLRSVKHVMRAFECICNDIKTLHPEPKWIFLAFLEYCISYLIGLSSRNPNAMWSGG